MAAAPAAVAAAWLPAALVPAYLRAQERNGSLRDVDVSSFRKTWLLWRAMRAGQPGAL